ncbi:hypothetical protein EDD22DRAFT_854633, partial [Suillus occidentalis]
GTTPLATAAPAASQPSNLGFNLPLAVPRATPPATSRHVGYDFQNESLPAAITNAAPGPSTSSLPDTVGDAERAAIDIVHCLGGEEYDGWWRLGSWRMIFRDPKPDEVIQSNKMMLMAFCESRDWLTRIFKDLISLHHLAQLHERVLPSVESLLNEVHQAEAGSGEEIDSGDDM